LLASSSSECSAAALLSKFDYHWAIERARACTAAWTFHSKKQLNASATAWSDQRMTEALMSSVLALPLMMLAMKRLQS